MGLAHIFYLHLRHIQRLFSLLCWSCMAWTLPHHVAAQDLPAADSIRTTADSLPLADAALSDSLRQPTFFNFRKTNPDPRKSLRYSLILPGAGQLYNGRWWKVPVVYGGLGAMIVAIDFNQNRYRRLKTALELELQDQPHEFTGRIDSPEALRSLRNTYDRQTQLSYIGTAVIYAVIAVEAFVDAHLQNFDIDEDLSLRLKPALIAPPGQGIHAGIGIALQF